MESQESSGAVPAAAAAESYKWQVLIVGLIGMVMAMLDSSIVNVSLPTIMADFGCTLDDIEWVVTGYMLAFATLMPLTAWLRDHIGHKKLYIAALALFTFGSILCGMSWNLPSLITARVIQALGGGALGPTTMAMIADVFPPRERGKAMGYFGMTIVVGPAIGPTLGGFLTHTLGWRSIFTVNIPVGVVGILMATAILKPDTPHESQKRGFDSWGFAFLTVFLVSSLLGLSKGEAEGWTSNFTLACFALAVLGFAAFLLVESLTTERIMALELFKIPAFTACQVVGVVRSIALFGGIFLIPMFLQRLRGLDEIQSGLILLPGALVMAFAMPMGGWIGDRIGPRYPALIGLSAQFIFLFMYRDINPNTGMWAIILPTLIRSLGMPLAMAPIMATVVNSVPKPKIAMASSMTNIIQQVGGSVGIALLTTVLSHRTHFHMADAAAGMSANSPAVLQTLSGLTFKAQSLGLPMGAARRVAFGALGKYLATRSMVAGFQDAFLFASVLVAVSVGAVFLLPTQLVGHGEILPKAEVESAAG
jgi:EmrB/QacA subfamily drug resistance transporter